MYQDYKDLLSAFHAHGVKYLIVGAYAVIFRAQPHSHCAAGFVTVVEIVSSRTA